MQGKRGRFFAGVLVFLLGLLLLFKGADFGTQSAKRALKANDGSMETQQYYYIQQTSANAVQAIGAVLSLLGGICVIKFSSNEED